MLLALAIALLAYVMVYEWPQPVDKKTAHEALRLLPDVTPSAVNRVEYTSTNQPLAAELRDHRWRLVLPDEYPADEVAIQMLLRQCSELKSTLTIKPAEIDSLADFGLDPPRGTLTISQGSTRIRLNVGVVTPVNNQLYVQTEGSGEVSVVDGEFARYLPRQHTHWRNPYLLDLHGLDFNRVRIRNQNNITMFERGTNGRWRITQPPPPKRANSEIIDQLIDFWKKWPVRAFVTDTTNTPLETWGLDKPAIELSLSQGTNQLLSVQFGGLEVKMTNTVYARLPMSDDVVLAESGYLYGLMQHYWTYCDHRMIDPVKEEDIDVIRVTGRESFSLRRRTNENWHAENEQRTPIDPLLMHHFLETLKGTVAEELEKQVVTDYARYGLDKPSVTYRLFRSVTNASGQSTNMLIGGIEFGKAEVDRVFARRHDENAVYVVSLGRLRSLPQSLYQIRSRKLWSFQRKNVAGVTVFNDTKTNRFVRRVDAAGDAQWELHVTNRITQIDLLENAAIDEAVRRLSMLEAAAWIDRGTNKFGPYKIGQHFGGLTIEMATPANRKYTVLFGVQPVRRNPFAAYRDPLDGEWVVFEFPAALYQDFVLPYLSIKDQ